MNKVFERQNAMSEQQCFETFVLFYVAWQEHEISLREMKEMILAEIGEEGLTKAIAVFRSKRLEREATASKKTLYDVLQEEKGIII